ncbi:MAG: AsmA family protein [Burkholderiales bacterium]|nr:AsmA family protein [Burkholderiales bacterium]
MKLRSGCLRSTTAQRGRVWVRLLIGAAAALLVLVVGAFIAVSLVDWDRHLATLAAKVKEETGRELRVAGPVEVGLLPPRVIADGVSFGNAAWGSRPEMVKAQRAEASLALLPLLAGRFTLRIDLVTPDVLLERNAAGEGNWELARRPPRAADVPRTDGSAPPVDLDRVRITKATIAYRSGRTGKTRRLLVDQGLVRPKGLSGREITLKAALDGVPVELVALTDRPPIEVLARRETLGVKLEAKTAGARVAADGRIGFPASGAALDMMVSADVSDAASIARIAGVTLPALPPLTLTGRLSAAKKVYQAEALELALGRSSASGRLAVDLNGARAKLTGELAARTIDVTELRGRRGSKAADAGAGGDDARVFSRTPLPLAALNALDADVGVRVARLVVTPELLLEDAQGRLALERGRLALRPLAMRIGGGDAKLVGTFDVSSGKSATLDATLTGSGIELGKMMAALGRSDDVAGGRTELAASLRGSGGSMAALAGDLDGHAKIVVRSARVKGGALDRLGGDVFVQLANAVNPARQTDPYTEIQCAVVNVPVRDGVVVVDRTVAVETPKVGVAMAGTVNLGTERLDLSVRPQAKQGVGVGLGSLANLAKLEGTLKQPKVGIDMKGAAGTAAQVGIGVMTGGLSILAKGLFDKATMDAPCETALRGGASAAAAGDRPAPKADAPSSGGGIGGFFERLFK